MSDRRILWVLIPSLLVPALTACNLGGAPEPTVDANALYTEAAQTLMAEFGAGQTQTAQAAPPTPQASPSPLPSPTPLPTFALPGLTPLGTVSAATTPLPTSAGPLAQSYPVGCDDAKFIGETVPDKTTIKGQDEFDKAWSLLNVGTCAWDEGYTFSFKSGERLSGNNIKIVKEDDFTEPGSSQSFVVKLQAPKNPGEYIGYWQMKNDAGVWFGSLVSVYIIVN